MRQSGILMHITSLPSPGGIGDLGAEAYAFADFLRQSGMKVWQVLPVGPTGYGESPYQSSSAFAGNPLLISPARLREEGLLSFEDSELYVPENPERAAYGPAMENRMMLLRRAYRQSREKLAEEISDFSAANPWAKEYALFSALKDHFGGGMWSKWPAHGIRNHWLLSRWYYGHRLKEEADFRLFCQVFFRRQWLALKKYCNDRGISLLGDMPIYVAEDSAETWAHPRVFQMDRRRLPTRVAGVPPDYFSEDGQLWGNPLYNWDYLRKTGFAWWLDRMRAMSELFDIVRVDHFIGFANYYSIPYGAPNARQGEWINAPGGELFAELKRQLPGLRIVAEDLGEVTDRVLNLMAETGFPGMRVMCYGFDGGEDNPHFPANYTEHMVLYTGTHDNDTVRGWAEKADPKALRFAEETLGFSGPAEAPRAFIQAALKSPAETVILPMQDVLGLDGSARMNLPGTTKDNWRWRMKPGAAGPETAAWLSALNLMYGRS
ncbi:MAG: 4-alpha-glucanotransferase [Clostridia bacterium]|nr:4-alpha-glucanotransferase [Clostridia bacterium]